MKISKYIVVDKSLKWNYFSKRNLLKNNKCKDRVYLICTSPKKSWILEIIESKDISSMYEEYYLVGVAKTYTEAVVQVKNLVDKLYNTNTLQYEELVQ